MLYIIGAVIVGYFMGCIQTSYIVGRLKGIDIREHGSHNAGASNAFMTLGWKYGILVGVLDILKVAIPVFLIKTLVPDGILPAFACGVGAMIGHIYPVFLKFKGGKGTACIVGLTLGLNPILFLIAGALIILATFISDYIAIGTLVMLVGISVSLVLMNYGMTILFISLGILTLSIHKHWVNYVRIYHGEEVGLKAVLANTK